MRHQSSADRHSFAIESYFREQKIRYYLLFIYYFIIYLFIYLYPHCIISMFGYRIV
jgi:hypothetical protein